MELASSTLSEQLLFFHRCAHTTESCETLAAFSMLQPYCHQQSVAVDLANLLLRMWSSGLSELTKVLRLRLPSSPNISKLPVQQNSVALVLLACQHLAPSTPTTRSLTTSSFKSAVWQSTNTLHRALPWGNPRHVVSPGLHECHCVVVICILERHLVGDELVM
jgi:hypothetical protein